MPDKGKLTAEEVVAIRERHAMLREFREDPDTGDRMTDGEIDTKVSGEFGVSRVHVGHLVTGKSRPEVGGPLDTRRAEIAATYYAEAAALGVTEANRRRRLRNKGIDPTPEAVVMVQRATIIDARGKDTDMAYELEPGQSIRLDLVPRGGV
ncbi:hypothetical protein SEA_UPYO_63 [Gordonia phage Upyo]|nr:hypothetical protein SEA_UPYO_63 [Gordonia phage Upyo]